MKGRGGPFAARTGYAPRPPAGHFLVPAPSPRVMQKRGGVGVGLEAEGYTPGPGSGKMGKQTPGPDVGS